MKVKLLAIPLAILTTSALAASNNTVQFQGEVNAQTCTVNINGNSTAPIVLLPTVSTADLDTAAKTAGDTKFTVNVTGCASSAATIKTVFAGNNVTAAGNLGNTATSPAANNVSIQIVDSDGSTPLSFVNGSTVTTSEFTKAESSTTGSQELTARYYAESTGVTAGKVVATAQYSISYQ